VPGVATVHDLHVWTITSGMDALSAHIVIAEGMGSRDAQRILETLNAQLSEQFKINHTTIQVEHASRAEKETRL